MRKLNKILVLVLTLSLLLGMFAVFASAADASLIENGDTENVSQEASQEPAIDEFAAENDAFYVVFDTDTKVYISHGTTQDEFVAALQAPTGGTTIKLFNDVDRDANNAYIAMSVTSANDGDLSVTLDLNGKTWKNYSSSTKANSAKGIQLKTADSVFILTSSKPDAVIVNNDDIKAADAGNVFIYSISGAEFILNGENITYYGARLLTTSGNGSKSVINGGRYVQRGLAGGASNAFIQIGGNNATNNVLEVYDAYISATTSGFIVMAADNNTYNSITKFKNCHLISDTASRTVMSTWYDRGGEMTFEDCEIYGKVGHSKFTYMEITLIGDNILSSEPYSTVKYARTADDEPVELGDNLIKVDAAGTRTYIKPTVEADDNNALTFETEEVACAYQYTTMADADLAKIEWTLGGEVKATTRYIPGLEEQTYTKTGKVLEGFVINTYEASKTAALEKGTVQAAFELAKTETHIEGLMYNLNLDSSMSINLAIPKAAYESAGFTVTDGTNPLVGTPTVIGEADYYLVTLNSIDAISTTEDRTFVLKVGNAEAQTVTLSVAGYAAQLLENGANDVEKELARAILQYALDAEKSLDADDADAIEELTAFLGTKVDTGVKNDSFGTVHKTDGLKATDLYGVFLRLDNNPGIVFQADEGKTVTFTVTYGGVTNTMEITKEGGEVVLDLKVYNFDTELTINVGGVDYSYNLATYLTGLCDLAEAESDADVLNEALANSVYNLVKAAQAYRAQ